MMRSPRGGVIQGRTRMRGSDGMQEALFTMSKLEDFVPSDHPLRAIQVLVNEALERLNGLFNEIYADTGRQSIAPEKLMRALLLQVFYSVRSERQLVEQHRSGCAAVQEELQHGVDSLLPGARADGEPIGVGRRCGGDARQRHE